MIIILYLQIIAGFSFFNFVQPKWKISVKNFYIRLKSTLKSENCHNRLTGYSNNYGGLEQFAEYLSKSLVARNHEVWVCNPHYHHYRGNLFFGVNIKHIYNPETILGTSGNFIYDYLCLRFAIKVRPDIILMLGYTTSSVWFRIFNFGDSILVTNLDGLEWKRDKWGVVVKRLTRWFETLPVKYDAGDDDLLQVLPARTFMTGGETARDQRGPDDTAPPSTPT